MNNLSDVVKNSEQDKMNQTEKGSKPKWKCPMRYNKKVLSKSIKFVQRDLLYFEVQWKITVSGNNL